MMRALSIVACALASTACVRTYADTQPAPATAEVPGHTCRVEGPPEIVAENVYGTDVVAQIGSDGRIEVVADDQVAPCLHVGIAPDRSGWEREGTVLGACPQTERDRVSSEDGSVTYLARELRGNDGLSHVALGYVSYDWPRSMFGIAHEARRENTWHWLCAPDADACTGESAPAIAPIQGTSFFVAWLEGDAVRGAALGAGARPTQEPIDISSAELHEIGRPSVAFAQDGHGLVAFTASTPTGVHALATRVTCTAPSP